MGSAILGTDQPSLIPRNFAEVVENTGYWQVDQAAVGSLVTYAIAVRTILPGFASLGAERESLVDTIKKQD